MGPWRRWARITAAAAVVVGAALASPGGAGAAASPSPPLPTPDASWLDIVNYYRAMAGVAPVVEDPTWSAGASSHSCYMLQNGMTHDEVPGLPGYTAAGDAAGNAGNIAVSSAFGTAARNHIELWMTGPFHAIGVLRHNLATVGFGGCDLSWTPTWHSGATLSFGPGFAGLVSRPRPSTPILFPGNGTTTRLTKFVVETPNPVALCGWTGGAGLPLVAMMPEAPTTVSSSLTGPSGPIPVCTLHAGNTADATAAGILRGDNAVVVVPRTELTAGTYTARVVTSARTVQWSFTVDPTAVSALPAPAPSTSAIGPASGFSPLIPTRLVDTRSGLGATRLQPGVAVRVAVAGQRGVPAGATAISANLTVTGPSAAGYLTAYPCGPAPLASTVNYRAGEIVPNSAIVPLDATGGVCLRSSTAVDVVMDVNGAFTTTATGRLMSVSPTRVFDTRIGFRAPGRLAAGQVLTVNLAGTGVPSGSSAVVLNLTAVRPGALGFVTAYPCDQPRPTASNLNPKLGETRPNQVVVPVAADGTVCFYTEAPVDLVADLAGYVTTSGTTFTPLAPTRITDTRDRYRPEMNAGTGGTPVPAGGVLRIPMAGVRGIPAGATAVSVNVTTTDTLGNGYVTAYPCAAAPPNASTINLQPLVAVPNAAQVRLDGSGALCVYTTDAVHVVVDINGVWS